MRRSFFIGGFMVVAWTLGGCQVVQSPPAADPAKVTETVMADVHQLIADFSGHDAVAAVSHDAPEYVGMFHGMPNIVGPAADLEATKQQVADPSAKVEVSDESVDVAKAGDMAVYRSTYTYTYTNPATKLQDSEKGNWVIGYKKQPDGTMKIAWSVVSDTGPIAGAAPVAVTPSPAPVVTPAPVPTATPAPAMTPAG